MSDTIASFNVEYTRFLDPSGRATQPFPDGTSDRATLVKLYRAMVLTRTFDAKGVNLSIVQGSDLTVWPRRGTSSGQREFWRRRPPPNHSAVFVAPWRIG